MMAHGPRASLVPRMLTALALEEDDPLSQLSPASSVRGGTGSSSVAAAAADRAEPATCDAPHQPEDATGEFASSERDRIRSSHVGNSSTAAATRSDKGHPRRAADFRTLFSRSTSVEADSFDAMAAHEFAVDTRNPHDGMDAHISGVADALTSSAAASVRVEREHSKQMLPGLFESEGPASPPPLNSITGDAPLTMAESNVLARSLLETFERQPQYRLVIRALDVFVQEQQLALGARRTSGVVETAADLDARGQDVRDFLAALGEKCRLMEPYYMPPEAPLPPETPPHACSGGDSRPRQGSGDGRQHRSASGGERVNPGTAYGPHRARYGSGSGPSVAGLGTGTIARTSSAAAAFSAPAAEGGGGDQRTRRSSSSASQPPPPSLEGGGRHHHHHHNQHRVTPTRPGGGSGLRRVYTSGSNGLGGGSLSLSLVDGYLAGAAADQAAAAREEIAYALRAAAAAQAGGAVGIYTGASVATMWERRRRSHGLVPAVLLTRRLAHTAAALRLATGDFPPPPPRQSQTVLPAAAPVRAASTAASLAIGPMPRLSMGGDAASPSSSAQAPVPAKAAPVMWHGLPLTAVYTAQRFQARFARAQRRAATAAAVAAAAAASSAAASDPHHRTRRLSSSATVDCGVGGGSAADGGGRSHAAPSAGAGMGLGSLLSVPNYRGFGSVLRAVRAASPLVRRPSPPPTRRSVVLSSDALLAAAVRRSSTAGSPQRQQSSAGSADHGAAAAAAGGGGGGAAASFSFALPAAAADHRFKSFDDLRPAVGAPRGGAGIAAAAAAAAAADSADSLAAASAGALTSSSGATPPRKRASSLTGPPTHFSPALVAIGEGATSAHESSGRERRHHGRPPETHPHMPHTASTSDLDAEPAGLLLVPEPDPREPQQRHPDVAVFSRAVDAADARDNRGSEGGDGAEAAETAAAAACEAAVERLGALSSEAGAAASPGDQAATSPGGGGSNVEFEGTLPNVASSAAATKSSSSGGRVGVGPVPAEVEAAVSRQAASNGTGAAAAAASEGGRGEERGASELQQRQQPSPPPPPPPPRRRGSVAERLVIPPEALEHLRNALERRAMTALYRHVFGVAPEDAAEDAQVSAALRRLRWLSPSALKVPDGLGPLVLRTAIGELRGMNARAAPEDKLAALASACTVLYKALTLHSRRAVGAAAAAGADDFLPAMIYVTLQADVPRLASNIAYIERFRDDQQMMGRAGYCFINLRSCVYYLRSCVDAAAVDMDPALFAARCAAAEAGTLQPWLETV